jgi:hypothetical protein
VVKNSRLKHRGPDMRTPIFVSSFLGQNLAPLFVAHAVKILGPRWVGHEDH